MNIGNDTITSMSIMSIDERERQEKIQLLEKSRILTRGLHYIYTKEIPVAIDDIKNTAQIKITSGIDRYMFYRVQKNHLNVYVPINDKSCDDDPIEQSKTIMRYIAKESNEPENITVIIDDLDSVVEYMHVKGQFETRVNKRLEHSIQEIEEVLREKEITRYFFFYSDIYKQSTKHVDEKFIYFEKSE